jgi:MFS family permease
MSDSLSNRGLPLTTRGALVLAAFATALAFSIILPNLPSRIAAVSGFDDPATISRHTGLMTAAYTAAIFVSAPFLGRISDGWGRRPVLVLGLAGFSTSLMLFELAGDLLLLYTARALAGVSAAAITPVALATVGDWSPDDGWRARRFAWIGAATMIGFMVGPLLGGTLSILSSKQAPPLFWPIVLALVSACVIARTVPVSKRPSSSHANAYALRGADDQRTSKSLLVLAAIVAGSVAAFDVHLALRGNLGSSASGLTIGLMLAECSAVMLLAQILVFSPLVPPKATRWLIAPALGMLGLALALASAATTAAALALGVGAIAAAAGIAAPIITYWTSLIAGEHQGEDLGRWIAVTSLGQAVGSAAAGLLLSHGLSNAMFAIASALALAGMIIAAWLAKQLA